MYLPFVSMERCFPSDAADETHSEQAPDDYMAPKTASNPAQRVYQRVEAQQ